MALLDSTAYDLTTDVGQQEAIQDILDEQNDQFDNSQKFAGLPIAVYGVAQVTLATPPWSGGPYIVKNHGLGFVPLFLVYFGTLQPAGIFSVPLIDFSFIGYSGVVQFFADKTNLYVKWDDQAQAPVQTFTYIIFNKPIV